MKNLYRIFTSTGREGVPVSVLLEKRVDLVRALSALQPQDHLTPEQSYLLADSAMNDAVLLHAFKNTNSYTYTIKEIVNILHRKTDIVKDDLTLLLAKML